MPGEKSVGIPRREHHRSDGDHDHTIAPSTIVPSSSSSSCNDSGAVVPPAEPPAVVPPVSRNVGNSEAMSPRFWRRKSREDLSHGVFYGVERGKRSRERRSGVEEKAAENGVPSVSVGGRRRGRVLLIRPCSSISSADSSRNLFRSYSRLFITLLAESGNRIMFNVRFSLERLRNWKQVFPVKSLERNPSSDKRQGRTTYLRADGQLRETKPCERTDSEDSERRTTAVSGEINVHKII